MNNKCIHGPTTRTGLEKCKHGILIPDVIINAVSYDRCKFCGQQFETIFFMNGTVSLTKL